MGPGPVSCGLPDPSICWQPPVRKAPTSSSAGQWATGRLGASEPPPSSPAFFFKGLPVTLEPCAKFQSHTNIKALPPSLLSPNSTDLLKAKPQPSSPQNFHGSHLTRVKAKVFTTSHRAVQNFLPFQFLTSTHSPPAMSVSLLILQPCSCLRALLFAYSHIQVSFL